MLIKALRRKKQKLLKAKSFTRELIKIINVDQFILFQFRINKLINQQKWKRKNLPI